jgi:ferredoxin
MLRKIIQIDEEKCDGCGQCIPNCHEGALQIIDGKARLISDLFCDGLGACLGHCPTDALKIEEREAVPYDEKKVMESIVRGGANVIKAHLEHLREHEEFVYLRESIEFLKENGIVNPIENNANFQSKPVCGCPGSQVLLIDSDKNEADENGERISYLKQWPIQLHLVSPRASYFNNSDLLIAADCCGFAYPDFHRDFLKRKSLAIACPKLDTNKDIYLEKLITLISESKLKSITILIMQVPCCGGLVQLVEKAIAATGSSIPVNVSIISHTGKILQSTSLN